MLENILNLSVEQEFQLRVVKGAIAQMSEEQKDSMLLEMARQLMVKDNTIKSLVKEALPPLQFK